MTWQFRMPRRARLPRVSWRVLAWAGAAMIVMGLWMTAPLGLRRLRFFRVRQVEIVGIRYLDADQVLAALRLSPAASVFDETGPLAERLRGLDGIADASVVRRPPGSLKVIVREIEPVALMMNERGALAPVDADGRQLPFDLAGLDCRSCGRTQATPVWSGCWRACRPSIPRCFRRSMPRGGWKRSAETCFSSWALIACC